MFVIRHRSSLTHDAVLGLDPRITHNTCKIENAPRIKSEGSTVGLEAFGV